MKTILIAIDTVRAEHLGCYCFINSHISQRIYPYIAIA